MHGDSAPAHLADGFRLDGWLVVPSAHEMVRPGETVHVEPKPMEVLVQLAARPGEAVSREALLDAVWPGVFVTDHALNRCISRLRKLFGDDPRAPRVIETIPKAGYRLVAPVELLGDSVQAPLDALDLRVVAAPEAAPTSAPRRFSMAIVLGLGVGAITLAALSTLLLRPEAPATRALTVDPGVESNAAWSPDGMRLAYIHAEGEAVVEPTRLLVRALGTDAPLVLTEGHYDRTPAWSPDGSQVAFVRCAPTCAPYVVSAVGEDERRLGDVLLRATGIAWTPDGRSLLVTRADTAGLARLDLATGRTSWLTRPEEGSDIRPRVSPDGDRVAFVRLGSDGPDLYVADLDGSDTRRLTEDRIALPGHTWSEDGGRLLFSSARSGVYALWEVDADGGTPRPVVGPAVRDPGGVDLRTGRLVVEDWAYEVNLWRSVDGAEPERVVASTLWDRYPALSPDGRRLAFISNRTGPPELWVADADGTDPVRLTDLGGASIEAPRWSPDGQTLAVVARIDGPAAIYTLPAEGGSLRRLTDDGRAPRWSRDGRSVLFASRRSGPWEVWRVPASGGQPRQVTRTGGLTAEELPDGSLLVAKPDVPGLWRVDGEAETRVSSLPALADAQSWAWTDDGVLLPDRAAGEVIRLRLGAGEPVPAGVPTTRMFTGEASLTASADGRSVVVARSDRVEADLLVAEPIE